MNGKRERHRYFELRVILREGEGYGLALLQKPVGSENGRKEDMVVRIWGDPLRSVLDQVLGSLKRGGYRPSDLRRTRQAPFSVEEEDGVRLGLLFLALKPLRKLTRIEKIAQQVRVMEPEELYYWFSKMTSDENGRRASRALRILMAEE